VPSAQCPQTEILGQSQVVVFFHFCDIKKLATFSRKLSKLVKLVKFLHKKKKCKKFPKCFGKKTDKMKAPHPYPTILFKKGFYEWYCTIG
jgi:hypothetical protein